MIIPYGKQSIDEDDINSVISVLRSDYLTQGPMVPEFEKLVASYCGSSFAVAVSNATAALHLALLSLDIGKNDHVWTSPISFVASANCALYVGANVSFIDINQSSYNMDISELERKLIIAEEEGKLPKVIIPVHLSGRSCDMKNLFKLKKKYGFYIIEDASHAIGGSLCGKKIGSCEFSDACVFSLHPVKIITTGEGGVLTTNNKQMVKKLSMLRSHGITRDTEIMGKNDGPWYYEQRYLGFNYRMSEMQAALGITQIKKLDLFVEKRRNLATSYDNFLKGKGFILPEKDNSQNISSWHLYIIRTNEDLLSKRDQIFNAMRERGIGVNIHYIPIYRQPYYESNFEYKYTEFPVSEIYYKTAFTIPLYPDLAPEEQAIVVKNLEYPLGYQTIF